MAEAKLTIKGAKQKSLEAQNKMIMNLLDSGDSDELAASVVSTQGEEASVNQSRSLLEDGDGEITMVVDGREQRIIALDDQLSQQVEIPTEQSSELITQPDTNEIVREIQEELDQKTKSLEEAISEKNTLETMLSMEINQRKYVEAKLAKAKADLEENEGIVVDLQQALKNPAPPTDLDPAVEGKLKKLSENNRVLVENNKILTAKSQSQKKEIETLRKKLKDAQAVAEGERKNAQSWEHRVNMLTGDMNQLKGLTYCKVEACTDEKVCGRSHAKKPENRRDCQYWLKGYCRWENRCHQRHDVGARSRALADTSDDVVVPIGANQGNNSNTSSNNPRQPKAQQPRAQKKKGGGKIPNQTPLNPQLNPPQQPPQLNQSPQLNQPPPTQQQQQIQPPTQPPQQQPLQPLQPLPPPHSQTSQTPHVPPQSAPVQTHQYTPLAPLTTPLNMVQYPHFIPTAAQNFPNLGTYPNIGWVGVNIPQLTAIQAQSMTRSQKQEEVRLEINKLREQINTANSQLPGQGTVDLQALITKEAELTRSLTQTYL